MWTVRAHVDSLAELDRDIKLQLESLRDAYRLATDSIYLERTYRIEQAIDRLVAERVQTTGESKATAVAALSKDAAAIKASVPTYRRRSSPPSYESSTSSSGPTEAPAATRRSRDGYGNASPTRR